MTRENAVVDETPARYAGAVKPRILVVPVAGLALVTSLVLSGCSFSPFPPAPLPGGGTGGGSSSSGGDGSGDPVVEVPVVEVPADEVTVDEGSSASIPATFPSDIPLIDGPVVLGIDLGTTWTVMISTPDLGRGYDDAKARLISAEYTTELDSTTADGSFGVFESMRYLVTLSAKDDAQFGNAVTYIVILKE